MSIPMSRIRPRAGALLCAALITLTARASPPAAPSNVIYTSGPKLMNFSWDIVPRSNYYELWFKANDGAAPVKFGERKPWDPHWHNGVSSHLLNWSQARWEIRACNPSGCSSTGLIDTGSTVVNTVGYVKTQHPVAEARFGSATAVSEDGKTFAAIASDEPVTEGMAAAVYVFRSKNGIWSQIGRFVPATVPTAGDAEGASLSLRADGDRIVVSLPHECGTPPSTVEIGGVHVVDRATNGSWSDSHTFRNPAGEHIGRFAKASEAGDVVAYSEDAGGGRIEIWGQSAGTWARLQEITGGGPQQHCRFDMSGDGLQLARACEATFAVEFRNTHTGAGFTSVGPPVPPGHLVGAVALDYGAHTLEIAIRPRDVAEGDYVAANWMPQVQVYLGSATSYFELASTLHPSSLQPTAYAKRSFFGDSLAVSHYGTYVAINDPHDALGRPGVWPPDELGGGGGSAPPAGAVYLFERAGAGFRLRRHVGPEAAFDASAEGVFGAPSLGDNGKTMVIGEPLEDFSASGIGAFHYTPQLEGSGAAWLY